MQAGQDKVRGIFNYVHLYGPWHLHLIQGRAGEPKLGSRNALRAYDGIIAGQMMLGLEVTLARTRKPLVLMDPLDDEFKPDSPIARFSYTRDDSADVGRSGAEYFLDRGYRHFAYVGESLNRNWSVRRGEAFANRVAEADHACQVFPLPDTGTDAVHAEKLLSAWLRALPTPVALLAAMDTRAIEVIGLCAEAGLRVPQDVAVLGIDNDELVCNGSIPTLSSIQRETVACGFMAAGMLDRLMRKENGKKEVKRYGVREIVTRDSTQPQALVTDPLALRAQEFIRINAGAGIGVPDVVRHLNVSRRLLEMRFSAACQRSLLEEIQNARLDRAGKLLRDTDLPLTQVCSLAGFQTDVHLRRVFKQRFGVPMREYRERHRRAQR